MPDAVQPAIKAANGLQDLLASKAEANTKPVDSKVANKSGGYKDKEKRREYMRLYMARRRAK